MSSVRLRRLQADYEKMRAFLQRQPRIRLIQVQGTPPERYQLEFQIRGLREVDEQLQTVANHMVEIALPLSYPRLPPQCRMLTPVFHPNIAPHAICIGDHWNAGEPLWSMVARIGEMIAYQSYNTKSPLNGEAARWVESNQDKLPLDKTNFMLDDAQPTNGQGGGEGDPSVIPFQDEFAPRPAASPSAGMAQRPAAAPVAPPAAASPLPVAAPARPAYPVARPVGSSPPMAIPLPPSPPVARSAMAMPPPAARPAVSAAPPVPSAAPPASEPAANIVIQCGQCASRYSVPAIAAGKKVRCKKCQAILLVPQRPAQT